MPEPCRYHTQKKLSYLAWHEEQIRRNEAGERQSRCPDCRLWLWPDEVGEHIDA